MRSHFLDRLRVEQIDSTRWMTLSPLRYSSALLGDTVVVPAEFITDFASVPRYLPVTWYLAGNTAHRPAVVHDFFYQRQNLARAQADAVFREAMAAEEIEPVPAWRRALLWLGVRAGGWRAWRQHERRAAALNPIWTREGWPE